MWNFFLNKYFLNALHDSQCLCQLIFHQIFNHIPHLHSWWRIRSQQGSLNSRNDSTPCWVNGLTDLKSTSVSFKINVNLVGRLFDHGSDQWASEEATSHCTAWNSKTFIPLPILIAISNTPPTKEGAISSKTVVRETTLFLIKINVLGQLVRHFYISTQTKSPSKMGDSY